MKTVVFWGAGATASLGIRTTLQQSLFVRHLAAPSCDDTSLDERVRNALGKADSPWARALRDLLTILGDDRPVSEATEVGDREIAAMECNWQEKCPGKLRRRILQLRATYDWLALKEIVKACPGSREPAGSEGFKINDLFNITDLHGQSGHGFHAGRTFLTPQQVGSAKNALKMLLQAMFFIDWQQAARKYDDLALHYDFARVLARRMQRAGIERCGQHPDSPEFYLGDVSFASMNYDPIGLWCQMIANRDFNKSPTVPHIGCPASKLEVFLDQAHFVSGVRPEKKEPRVWHSMSEAVVQRLNEVGQRIRVTKFLLPHGCLCWRECPNCGKLSNYCGDSWTVDSPTLIPPPPLRAFVPDKDYEQARTVKGDEERRARRKGEVDARACVHCDTLTYAHHTSTQMQSSLKERPPAFLEEIQRELRVVVKKAEHVVLMGYSLPEDDVLYRAFFAAHRSGDSQDVKCTVVDKKDDYDRWFRAKELDEKTDLHRDTAVGAARDIFGRENVRFYGGGVPNVFLEGSTVQDSAVERLLVWDR